MSRLFITGTDTGVGKTSYTAHLIRSWVAKGIQGIGLKPFATGDRGDAIELQQAMGGELSLDEINPSFYSVPWAPYFSAQAEGVEIAYAHILEQTKRRSMLFSHVAIEGAGGWLVPLTAQKRIRDFAVDCGFPVVLIARAGLGTLNHTLLTVESIRKSNLEIQVIILNLFPNENRTLAEMNVDFLRRETGLKVDLWLRD